MITDLLATNFITQLQYLISKLASPQMIIDWDITFTIIYVLGLPIWLSPQLTITL